MDSIAVLRTFIAVIDTGTVVAAARARGYSPAAVSRQLASLQNRLGVRLFRPSGRSIQPTPEALEYAERARDLVMQVERFEKFSRVFRSSSERRVGALTSSDGE